MVKSFLRVRGKRLKVVLFSVLAIIFLGFVISGISMLFPNIRNPVILIIIGIVGLSVMSWFGYGLLAQRK